MTRFIIRRLIATAFILVFLSIAVFTLIRVMPGNAACEGFISKEQCEARKAELNLDEPYFPLSLDFSHGQDWWLLAVPAAALAAYAAMRARRGRSPVTP
jgi:hypothetical protein